MMPLVPAVDLREESLVPSAGRTETGSPPLSRREQLRFREAHGNDKDRPFLPTSIGLGGYKTR